MLQALATEPVEVEGRLLNASNLALRIRLGAERIPAIYKPVRGERELEDFPVGTLARREVATYLIAAAGGWDHIPPTVFRDGPWGPGSVQLWVGSLDTPPDTDLVRVDSPAEVPDGYLPIIGVRTPEGPGVLSHADDPRLAAVTVLDLVVNNTDRKAGHLIEDGARLWGIDHGVTCHADPKVRTVLWGWVGQPLPEAELRRLEQLRKALAGPQLRADLQEHVSQQELRALVRRADTLAAAGVFPEPEAMYPLPWPLW